jgi:hypothetical protein
MHRKLIAAALLCFASAVAIVPSHAQAPATVKLCNGTQPNCPLVGSGNPLPVTGTISATLGGFTPSASGARGTPLTVTTGDSSGTLPSGVVVVVSNVGTTNPMYCNVNGVAATVSDQLITANGGWFAFTIPAAVTTLHCIATGGSTTANMLGGSGLATGTGGGSGGGGGGGGAITAALGSYAAGALSAGAFATGAGVDGWDITQGTKADAAWTTGSGSVISLLKAIAAAEIVTNRAVNVAQINGVTPLMGNGATGTGSQRVTIANDNTVPTGWPTSALQTTGNGSLASILASIGATSDAVCGSATGTCSQIALLKFLNTAAGLPLPAQANTTTNIGMVTHSVAANGGATPTGNIAANNTTAVVIKAGAGTLYGVQLAGIGSAPAYLKIYNATSATCGSGTPVKRLMIPAASTAANGAGSNITFGVAGVNFSTGITYCVTTGIGDSDTTAPAASTFLVNVDWQ